MTTIDSPETYAGHPELTVALEDGVLSLTLNRPDSLNSLTAAMLRTLAEAAGHIGMCGGQAIDIEATGQALDEDALRSMHGMKTGALIRASIRLGALAAGAGTSRLASLDAFASALGLAFQIKDDLLDAEGDTASLGKTAGKDAAEGKSTYVGLLGLTGARQRLADMESAMHASADSMDGDVSALRSLASMTVQRQH